MVTLDRWVQMMGLHPWHSWQLANQLIPISSQCNAVVYESAWQAADRVGRADIRLAIERAEALYSQYAHYEPRKKFKTATLRWPEMGDYRLTRYVSSNFRNRFLGHQLPEGYIHALGYEHIDDHGAHHVAYTDEDGDGLYETATVTVHNPKWNSLDEIKLTFLDADVVYTDTEYEIHPRSMHWQGNTCYVVINTPTLIRPILATRAIVAPLDPSILPPTANSPFPHQINVARRWCDPDGTTIDTAQAVLIWETAPYPAWALPWTFQQPTKDPSALAYAIARGNIRDSRQGLVYVGESVYDATTETWTGLAGFTECRPPDRVLFRYQAGVDDPSLDVVIARLAAAELARPLCACAQAQKMVAEWQIDATRQARDESFALSMDATNPIGVRRGHLYAWRAIQNAQITQGILA
jgi:hypothetical protein